MSKFETWTLNYMIGVLFVMIHVAIFLLGWNIYHHWDMLTYGACK